MLPDVDALARSLPQRGLAPERAAHLRRALLDAAEQSEAPRSHRGWIAAGAALAAVVCAVLAWRLLGGAPSPVVATARIEPAGIAPRVEAPAVTSTGSAAPIAAPVPAVPAPRPVPQALALDEGVHAVDAPTAVEIVRGDTTVTSSAGAKLDVVVRDGKIRQVTVRAGWVVIASARQPARMVAASQHWELPLDEAPVPPTQPPAPTRAPETAPKPPRVEQAPRAREPALPEVPAAKSSEAKAPDAKPPEAEAQAATKAEPDADAGDAKVATAPPIRRPPSQSERDFHDGLRTLMAGDAARATGALERACAAVSSTQADACYWTAVAWLRSGNTARARTAFGDVLLRFPGATHTGEASVALGWLLLKAGDRAGARARFANAANDPVPGVRAEALRGLAESADAK